MALSCSEMMRSVRIAHCALLNNEGQSLKGITSSTQGGGHDARH